MAAPMTKLSLTERFDRALLYASNLHRTQRRKGTKIPYVSHLLAVAGIVLENGGTEDEAIAALLHDTIEDHPRGGKTRGEIRKKFGRRVLKIVEGCSDASTHPKPPWLPRKKAFLARLTRSDKSVLRVVLADKTHNLQALLRDHQRVGPKTWERFNAGPKEQRWYYGEALKVLRRRLGQEDTKEFAQLVHALRKLTKS